MEHIYTISSFRVLGGTQLVQTFVYIMPRDVSLLDTRGKFFQSGSPQNFLFACNVLNIYAIYSFSTRFHFFYSNVLNIFEYI